MIYTTEVQHMCPVAKGAYHGPAPIPVEGKWVQAKEISDISGFTHGIGWCAPQQGAERARWLAKKTLSKVQRKVGFVPEK